MKLLMIIIIFKKKKKRIWKNLSFSGYGNKDGEKMEEHGARSRGTGGS